VSSREGHRKKRARFFRERLQSRAAAAARPPGLSILAIDERPTPGPESSSVPPSRPLTPLRRVLAANSGKGNVVVRTIVANRANGSCTGRREVAGEGDTGADLFRGSYLGLAPARDRRVGGLEHASASGSEAPDFFFFFFLLCSQSLQHSSSSRRTTRRACPKNRSALLVRRRFVSPIPNGRPMAWQRHGATVTRPRRTARQIVPRRANGERALRRLWLTDVAGAADGVLLNGRPANARSQSRANDGAAARGFAEIPALPAGARAPRRHRAAVVPAARPARSPWARR